MMHEARAVAQEDLARYAKAYQEDVKNRAMTHALSKQSVADAAYSIAGAAKTQFKFSIDIPTMPVTNQKSSGRCWLFAGLNVLREIIAKKYKIKEFELSQNYVAFWDKFEKINYFLETVLDTTQLPPDDRTLAWVMQVGVQDGGQWDMLVSLIKKYGLVSKDAMPETFQSSNTGAMNQMINTRLKENAVLLRQMAAQGASREELQEKKDEFLSGYYTLLCMCFTQPPQKFDFEYVDEDKKYHIHRDITPKAFYEDYIGDILDDYVSVIHAPTQDKPFHRAYTVRYLGNVVGGNPITYLNVPMPELKKLVIDQLKAGEVVWFGSDVSKFGTDDSWDDGAFDYASGFGFSLDLPKEHRLDYRDSAMNHAMVLTGVNLTDGEYQANRWKIENSWGDDRGGVKGYYRMSDTWFDQFVYQAVIRRDFLDDTLRQALKQEPVQLNPWDPMGSLAD